MKRRRRLIAVLAGLSLATLGAAFWAVYLANNRLQEHQLDAALLREAREEAREAGQSGGARLMISPRPGPQANDVGPLTKYAAIYAPDGRVVSATGSFAGAPPPLADLARAGHGHPFNLWHGAEHLRGVLLPIPAALHSQLLLAAPRTDLDGDEAFLGRAMLIVFAVAFAWVVLVSAWVVRRFTLGHELIGTVARKVAGGDMSARVPFAGKEDEVAQLAEDVNHMITRLSDLLAAHQTFIAHAAHELRSPLTALYGELSHALRRPRDASDYQRAIEEALDATRRLMALAEDLLTLARLSEDEEEPVELVEIEEVLRRAAGFCASEAAAKHVDVQVSGTAGSVIGRPMDLERLLRNLIENAVRHCPEGRPVRVVLELAGQQTVRVLNDGAIQHADRARIFEPFTRGAYASIDGRPGVGLGLTIAHQIARKHHGKLELAPSAGETIEFVLTLPLADER